jgi:dynein intermediate chain 2
MPHQSYIWDIMNPNTPDVEILPPSPLCCLRYNPKSPDILAGGSYNGLVTTYDIRKNSGTSKEISPTHTSMIENSHHDPVYDIFWINSKTGNQLVTVSTDGRLLWWDAKKLNEPLSDIKLQPAGNTGPILGGSSLEYNSEAGATKYLVGTEQGVVLLVNTKAKAGMNVTTFDGGPGKHHGPIYSIQVFIT